MDYYVVKKDDSFYLPVIGEKEINVNEFKTPGTHTWVCPQGVTSVVVHISGAGGGGGGCLVCDWAESDDVYSDGGGYGEDGQLITKTISVTPGQSYQIVVGAGGEKGTPLDNGVLPYGEAGSGGKGGDSSFSTYVAKGGEGGAGGRLTLPDDDGDGGA